jgi:hypothetical protein
MATETHIAGLQLTVKHRFLLQRCAWCGATMLAYDLTRVAVQDKPDGSPGEQPGLFPPGRLVRFSYDGLVARFGEVGLSRTSMEVLDDDEMLPDDCCTEHIPFEGDDG